MALIPVDVERCQAEKPGNGPFTLGGTIGDPKNGYRVRCDASPAVIVRETESEDGVLGAMALCQDCLAVFKDQVGLDHVVVEAIDATEDKKT